MKIVSTILLMVTLLCSACSTGPKNETLKEAAQVHNETLKTYIDLEKDVNIKIMELKAEIASIDPTNSGTVDELNVFLRGLEKSERVLDNWESSLVGVPGMEEHSHGVDDTGKAIIVENERLAKRLSDEEVLTMQKELNRTLLEIDKQIRKVIDQTDNYER